MIQFKTFTFPVILTDERIDDVNKFMQKHRIIDFEKHLIVSEQKAFWCFIIQFDATETSSAEKKDANKIDYKTMLSNDEFARFSKLRARRKEMAIEDAVPAFRIFTDAELAEIAKIEFPDANNIRAVKGIGDAKAEKYANRLLK